MNKTNEAIIYAYGKGYRVTEEGKLYGPKGREIPVRIRGHEEYPIFSVRLNAKKKKTIPIHRFAAYCFYKEKLFEDGLEVRHLNSNKLDVSKDNIKLGTHYENIMDKPVETRVEMARLAGKATVGIPAPNRKLTPDQVREIRLLIQKGMTGKSIGKLFGVCDEVIYQIKKGNRYKDVI